MGLKKPPASGRGRTAGSGRQREETGCWWPDVIPACRKSRLNRQFPAPARIQSRIATVRYTNIEAEAKAVISTAIHPCHFRQSIRFDVGPGHLRGPGYGTLTEPSAVLPIHYASVPRLQLSALCFMQVFQTPWDGLRRNKSCWWPEVIPAQLTRSSIRFADV